MTRLQSRGSADSGLRAHDLSLRVILGEEFTVAGRATSDVLFMVSRAIEGAETRKRAVGLGEFPGMAVVQQIHRAANGADRPVGL
jgi:hypothetical protein